MCGIVAVTGYKKALPLLINGLEKLEYRVMILQELLCMLRAMSLISELWAK